MKTKYVYIFLITIGVVFTSCNKEHIRASNEISKKSIAFSNFTELEIANNFNAFITFSDTEENIEVEANDNLHEFIIVKETANKLSVKLKDGISIKGKEILNIYITTKKIIDYTAFGDASFKLQNTLDIANATITLLGDSDFTGEIMATNLNVSLNGNSNIDVFGSIKNLDANVYGDSKLEDYDLEIENLKIKLYGDSNAYLTTTKTIAIEAGGNSSFYYKGSAAIVSKKLSGDSKVVKRD